MEYLVLHHVEPNANSIYIANELSILLRAGLVLNCTSCLPKGAAVVRCAGSPVCALSG